MNPEWKEERPTLNDIPLSVECLVMPSNGPSEWSHPHFHEYIELLYVLDGCYEVRLGDTITELHTGSLFIINAGELHGTRSTASHQVLLCVKFLPQILYSSEQTVTEMEYTLPYIFQRFGTRRAFDFDFLKNTCVPEAFAVIHDEISDKKFGYELAIRSEVLRIFTWIIRTWYEGADYPSLPSAGIVASAIHKARDYVEKNYTDATLSGAAKACNLSYGYFSRIFNSYMKMSFSDYVNMVRINKSIDLLATTDLSITDIAASSGFSSTSYYIQIFRRMKHIAPSRFRKLFRH